MTANYFMLTRAGIGLDGAKYQPFYRGSSAVTTTNTDARTGGEATPALLPVGDINGRPRLSSGNGDAWNTLPTSYDNPIFRVVRTPGVADDSANPLAQQVYDHGWPLIAGQWGDGGSLVDGATGELATWPPPSNLTVVPVTGTVVASDGRSDAPWYGMTAVTWPGSSVGVGTVRQIISGAEGANRKFASICDMLAATTSAQRGTIASTYAAGAEGPFSQSFFWNYVETLWTAVNGLSPIQKGKFYARMKGIYMIMATVDGGAYDGWNNGNLAYGVYFGMLAVLAYEAGLLAVSNNSPYAFLIKAINSVLDMPAGYQAEVIAPG